MPDYDLFDCGHCGKQSVADFDTKVDPYCYECDGWICNACDDGGICPQKHEGAAKR